ncbi:MAG: 4Fe-4S dicluster domain-containing protein [Clostridia bacterium]|nr:4Fe-4S dicluster domain-containing protein [Clostridia bacterium]
MQEMMKNKAKALLADGTVTRVIGWRRGEFSYDVTPAVFETAEEIERDFVWDAFCGANVSKYLIRESAKGDGKILAFLKPCDAFSMNQLLAEHRVKRESVYLIGIPCAGKADIEKIRERGIDGVSGIEEDGDVFVVHSIYGDARVGQADVLAERCLACKSKRHPVYDELLGEEGEDLPDDARFAGVAKLEAMTAEERFAFWRSELSKCIRCNACRNVCPACTCENCVFDNPASGISQKAAADPFEENMYHIIRAFHVAGRCTDCGECSRVCPERIPLHHLNRKFIKDIDELYGAYRAGEDDGTKNPLTSYAEGDAEPAVVRERGRA